MFNTEHLQEKWQPVLEHPDLPEIKDPYRRAVTTVILENQEKAMSEDREFLGEAAPANHTGSAIANWDPILISLVRRAMPSLIAYDVCGVQPMTGPTGLIFAMKARYASQSGYRSSVQRSQYSVCNAKSWWRRCTDWYCCYRCNQYNKLFCPTWYDNNLLLKLLEMHQLMLSQKWHSVLRSQR